LWIAVCRHGAVSACRKVIAIALDIGEIQAYCYMVQRGKPAAMVPIQKRHLKKAVTFIVKEFDLKYHIDLLCEGWATLWIYKQPHIREVIKTVSDKPETVFDHWVLGKLFGYEEAAIGDFLAKRG